MRGAMIFAAAGLVAVLAVTMLTAQQPAEACTSHGLVHAATLDDLYKDIPGLKFRFGHHHYRVTTPGGKTMTFNSWYRSGLNSVINIIEAQLEAEGVFGETEVTTNSEREEYELNEESEEVPVTYSN